MIISKNAVLSNSNLYLILSIIICGIFNYVSPIMITSTSNTNDKL